MQLSSKFLSFLFFLSLLSCSKESAFIPKELPTMLFVRAHIDPLLGVDILVSKAISTGDTIAIRDLLVTNAKVSLIDEQNNLSIIPHSINGKYLKDSTGLKILAGKKFQLKVEVTSIGTVLSDWIVIPELIKLDTLGFALDGGSNGNSPTASGHLEFKDNNTSNDYYLLRAAAIVEGQTPQYPNWYIHISDLCQTSGDYDVCFDETCFGNNTLYRIEMYSDTEIFIESMNGNKAIKEFYFYFGKVSQSYYDFTSSLNQPEDWDNGFVEPKKTYTNIKGGFGVFFASNTVQRKVKI
jgi:Domain of unknown function (DUF4249)